MCASLRASGLREEALFMQEKLGCDGGGLGGGGRSSFPPVPAHLAAVLPIELLELPASHASLIHDD